MIVYNFKSWAARCSNLDSSAFRVFLCEILSFAKLNGFRYDDFSFRRNFNKYGDVNSVTVYFRGVRYVNKV